MPEQVAIQECSKTGCMCHCELCAIKQAFEAKPVHCNAHGNGCHMECGW